MPGNETIIAEAKSGDGTIENVGIKMNGTHQCKECRQKFETKKALDLHGRFIHDPRQQECPHMPGESFSISELVRAMAGSGASDLSIIFEKLHCSNIAMSKIAKLVDAVNGDARSGGAIYQIDIIDVANGKFVIDLKSGAPTAYLGVSCMADVTVSIAEVDLQAMVEGKLNPMQVYMGGKLKVQGNMMLLMKLQDIMNAVN